jgi:hypothetical protein
MNFFYQTMNNLISSYITRSVLFSAVIQFLTCFKIKLFPEIIFNFATIAFE